MDRLNFQQNEAIRKLYESGYDRNLWRDSLQAFCETFDLQGAVTVPRIAAENAVNLPCSPSVQDMTAQFVSDGWYANDIRADRGWPLVDAGHPVVFEQDIITPEERARLAIYHELYLPHDLLWWAGVTFKTTERQYTISILRRPDQDPFTEDERSLFGHVRHHLAKALSIAEAMGMGMVRGSIDVLEALGHAAILVDGWGRVRACTGLAEYYLGADLTIANGRLFAIRPETNRQLQAMIGSTVIDQPMASAPLHITRLGRRPMIVDVLPVPKANRADFLFSHALVMLVDLDKRPVPSAERLRLAFALSPAEARLAAILVSGASLAEASDRLAVGRETVRSQLKSLFAKTDTSRQGELIAVLMRVGAPSSSH